MAARSDTNRRKRDVTASGLISGLPDDVALQIIRRLPPSVIFSVCRSWRRLLYSSLIAPDAFLCLYALLSGDEHSSPDGEAAVQLSAFDPLANAWIRLPSPPVRVLLRHPSFLSRPLPVQSISTCGSGLLLISATTDRLRLRPALDRPLIFDPERRTWSPGPSFTTPRRWCACGSAGGAVYVAGGIASEWSPHVARSLERWDPLAPGEPKWERRAPLSTCKLSRDAIDAVGWKSKLWMVNVKGGRHREGLVYCTQSDRWEAMPMGMLVGWTGPVAADENTGNNAPGSLYCVDESKGLLKTYDPNADEWTTIIESVHLLGASQMVVRRGKACVVTMDGRAIAVVDIASNPVRVWAMDPPNGFGVIGIHILQRPG